MRVLGRIECIMHGALAVCFIFGKKPFIMRLILHKPRKDRRKSCLWPLEVEGPFLTQIVYPPKSTLLAERNSLREAYGGPQRRPRPRPIPNTGKVKQRLYVPLLCIAVQSPEGVVPQQHITILSSFSLVSFEAATREATFAWRIQVHKTNT